MVFETENYIRSECAVFYTVDGPNGALSNMAPDMKIRINDVAIRTSEALYQAMRYPHLPELQRSIIAEASPMGAKMKSKPHRQAGSRPDWDDQVVNIMYWCLRVKLAQNWKKFGDALLATGDKPIVEQSSKDPFWGAKLTNREKPKKGEKLQPLPADQLKGQNVLGNLLMQLRDQLRSDKRDELLTVQPLPLENFCLYGQPISVIEAFNLAGKKTGGHQGSLW